MCFMPIWQTVPANIKLDDGIEPYMWNTEHPQSLHMVRFTIIEITLVQYRNRASTLVLISGVI